MWTCGYVIKVTCGPFISHTHSVAIRCVKGRRGKKMDDIDAMFSHLLGEMDHLSQSLAQAAGSPGVDETPQESSFSIGFNNPNESLDELEDHELDALMADLESKATEQEFSTHNDTSSPAGNQTSPPAIYQECEPVVTFPVVSTQSSRAVKMNEPQTKADKIKVALEKLKEAKVKKLIIKVLMSDSSSKTLMVDERQTVGDVLDKLFEKTHCESSIDWSLCEINPELQIERAFEDHECLVEPLSAWSRHSDNKLYFLSTPQKYMMFTEPQIFYMWKKKKSGTGDMNSQAKELLIKENFGGSTTIVPNLEGMLYLKEDGKKVWKPRYFMLRASGIYYVPKGKTKSSTDLACFVRFDKVSIYTSSSYRQKYRAPTDFCFLLKHPCIQKESPYIKFLCCEDKHTLLLWVNSIRIAKYGADLYKNYQAALKRASTVQTPYSAANKDKSNSHTSLESPYPGPSAHSNESVPTELPPDFIPSPPSGHECL
ncbi:amyloid beta A4 precursor protein-binding family B member 1-interacting protein isoform X1 [Fundulus heteroclitus]|uniref:amyloid beta A4 precursor protein-binding family B member 1-interacting protein isoform X1 n=3 Tax=Fundulus heteroclitus TaxID=8078 RepID=UPI00165C1A3F|nr:amyloid beta A4 precursor protein-binding family B member 1-interacting protein isoform X1 [Fundulus heteroclitus]